jgi:serine/threonine-protein kinase
LEASEKAFIRRLLESGRISFKDAGRLEQLREQGSAAGDARPVWELAVAEKMVDARQAEEVRRCCLDTETGKGGGQGNDAAGTVKASDTTASLIPVRPGGRGAAGRLGGFQLLGKLGQGGMGVVYKARQESMDRLVALKVLPRHLAEDKSFIDRFLREARAAGRLAHQNIVAGIDAGFADGYYYLAMEYVEGRSLGDRLNSDGPLGEVEVVGICAQLCEALAHAHGAGLIHRDIKPENVLVTAQGRAKLCDLGLARAGGEEMRVTMAGAAVGTPHYVSPEQVRGEEPDARSDIYSLGCTMYHLVSGVAPFDGPNPMAVMQMHLNSEARPLSEAAPKVSRALSAVVAKMMARERGDRYQSAAELLADLRRLAEGGVPAALTRGIADRRRQAAGNETGGGRLTGAPASSTRGSRPFATRPTAPRPGRTTADTFPMPGAMQGLPVRLLIVAAVLLILMAGGVIAVVVGIGSPGQGKGEGNAPGVDAGAGSDEGKTTEELQLARLYEKYEAVRSQEKQGAALDKLIEAWEGFIAETAGTPLEEQGRVALAEVRRRQQEAMGVQRLADLGRQFAELKAREARNPEDYAALIAGYEKLAVGAAGTQIEADAVSGADRVRRARSAKAREAAGQLRERVRRACAARDFGAALAEVAAFPAVLAGEVRAELKRMEDSVRADGRGAWEEARGRALRLAGERKFDEAVGVVQASSSLGLPGLEDDRAATLAEIELLRAEAQTAAVATKRQAYEKFARDWQEKAAVDAFADIVAAGGVLRGKLPADLDARLAVDLEIARGATDLFASLRRHLAAAKPGSFQTRLPLGDKQGRFRGFDADADTVELEFFPGSTSLRISEFRGELLMLLFRRAAGGRLTAGDSRLAACYCLARGELAEVEGLLKRCREDGVNVASLEARWRELGGAPPAAAGSTGEGE